ncbi:MAG TPA: hypothetical protein VGJ80_04950 [Gemmatimonadales bacterium]|jgi:hypothetical protein
MRPTPFALAFGEIEPRFPAIAAALQQDGAAATDRDRFVLLEPVGRLLREIVPEDAGADALEAHVLLLHHAYQFWAAAQRVFQISEETLRRAVGASRITTRLPHAAQYLQLPELRVWGAPHEAGPPEPLDGMFVSEAASGAGAIDVLAIFGLRPDRPGFSAVGLEGRADPDDPAAGEIEIAAARDDGSAPFAPQLPGGTAAGLYSVANAGELLLLTGRLLTLLDSG